MRQKGLVQKTTLSILLSCGALLNLFPLYLTVVTSFKTYSDSLKSFFTLPSQPTLDNYLTVFSTTKFGTFFANSSVITIVSCSVIILSSPLVSYAIARNRDKLYYRFLYNYIIAGTFIPFQVVMLPLVFVMSRLGIMDIPGVILLYITLALHQSVFLYVGYFNSVPIALEEAAYIDGCGILKTFFLVTYPLIKPMTATVLILNALWIWNDFLLPLVMLNANPRIWTLPLFLFNFKTQYTFQFNLAFASFVLTMIPIMVTYLFLQRYIINGLTGGALKS